MKIFYRYCDKNINLEYKGFTVTKKQCFLNFIKYFKKDDITLFLDNCQEETGNWFTNEIGINPDRIFLGHAGNRGSFVQQFYFINFDKLDKNEIIFMVEDDYLHTKNSELLIKEGLEKVDFVSLADPLCKYIKGVNPYCNEWGEVTRVFITNSSHWKFTNSTMMTFACKLGILQKYKDTIIKSIGEGEIPKDFDMWIKLKEMGATLACPIPGAATHICKSGLYSPCVDWLKEIDYE